MHNVSEENELQVLLSIFPCQAMEGTRVTLAWNYIFFCLTGENALWNNKY